MSTESEQRDRSVGAEAFAHVDEGVLLGYEPGRRVEGALVIGPGAHLRSGTVLYRGSRIGDRLQTGHHVVIREECEIGHDVSVWSNTVIDYGCRIGNRVKIHSNCYIAQFTTIDDDAFLAPGVAVANDLYPGDPASAEQMQGPHIESGAQIGVNATLLPYVTIGAGSIVGSGAVVTADVPPGMVVAGVPARVLRATSELLPIDVRRALSQDGAR
jgi:acetyltransferase-like isoleucine patch superfamily enzyme